jgi:hypothetical protein
MKLVVAPSPLSKPGMCRACERNEADSIRVDTDIRCFAFNVSSGRPGSRGAAAAPSGQPARA